MNYNVITVSGYVMFKLIISRRLMLKSRNLFVIVAATLISGCLGYPDSVTPVQGYDVNRYLGKWYEIARLDHSFEEGLDNVTAEYSLLEDGGVKVINRGYLTREDRWKESQGKAYFVNESDEGYLKVSFFGPFYGSYVIFELDKDEYQHAFVTGPNTSFLWLLSRKPKVDEELLDHFFDRATRLGFDTSKLIFPSQESRSQAF